MDTVTADEVHQPENDVQSLYDDITLKCEHKWQHIKLIQEHLGKVAVGITGSLHGNELSQADSVSLLREQKKRLEAELAFFKERGLQPLPENIDLQCLILHQDQEQTFQCLNETLAFMRTRRDELTECIDKEKSKQNKFKGLNASLKEKLSQINKNLQSREEDSSLEAALLAMQLEIDKMSAKDKSYKRTLIKLLNKYFSLSSEKDSIQNSRNVLNDSRSCDVNNLSPLHTIIGRLVEQTINSPANPYIDIDETMWPPHIEFLLRSQIVRKHPQDAMKIKLTPIQL